MEREGAKGQGKKQRSKGRERCSVWLAAMLAGILCMGLICTGCSRRHTASKIQLMKTQGTVDIANGRGREVTPVPEMKLYSGYHMETRAASYAWLNLDSLRLAKMDVSSQISIQRRQKELEILVDAGSLFFNIKEPLKEDETLDIRTGNMAVGIRGTCGWVEVLAGGDTMKVYLLEGKVLCEIEDGGWDVVRAGEMAVMTEGGEVEVSSFTAQDIPDFVMEEIKEDKELIAQVLEASGLDLSDPTDGPDPSETEGSSEQTKSQRSETEEALEQYRAILQQAASYAYGAAIPGDEYRYALVQMYAGDWVPTLLLSQRDMDDPYGGIENVRIFRYDPASKTVHQPEESLRTGVASAGGFRGSLSLDGDGAGLFYLTTSSGTGATTVDLVTLTPEGDTLHIDRQWEGRLDQVPEELLFEEIGWYDQTDMSGLDSWTPAGNESLRPAPMPEEADVDETAPTEAAPAETTTPTEPTPAETTAPAETTPAETTAPAEAAPAETTAPAEAPWRAAYITLLGEQPTGVSAEANATGYKLYDIDKDGIPELIIEYGSYEANHRAAVYTYQGGGVSPLTENINLSHCSLGTWPNGNGMLLYGTHMGNSWTSRLYQADNKLAVESLSSAQGEIDLQAQVPGTVLLQTYQISQDQPILSY